MKKTRKDDKGAVVRLFARLTGNSTVIRASADAASKMQAQRDRFEVERRQIEESIGDGARLTKHRITL